MRTIVIFRGLPGCGKSTLAAELCKKESGRWVRINRDDLRSMVVGPNNNPYEGAHRNSREEFIRNMKAELTRQAIREGYDVILDDTHLVSSTLRKLHELALSIGDIKVIEKGVNVPIEECIRRDALREGFKKVGEKVIRDMAKSARLDKGKGLPETKESYYPPRWAPGQAGDNGTPFNADPNLLTTIDCDLDGTTSLLNGRSPYDASTCDRDPPNTPVVECIKAMYAHLVSIAPPERRKDVKILFTSGREDKYREQTVSFLEQHLPGIPYLLYMRASGDQRKDSIIKEEMFNEHIRGKWNILFILDDRNQVVDKWREMGLHTFQVAPGNF